MSTHNSPKQEKLNQNSNCIVHNPPIESLSLLLILAFTELIESNKLFSVSKKNRVNILSVLISFKWIWQKKFSSDKNFASDYFTWRTLTNWVWRHELCFKLPLFYNISSSRSFQLPSKQKQRDCCMCWNRWAKKCKLVLLWICLILDLNLFLLRTMEFFKTRERKRLRFFADHEPHLARRLPSAFLYPVVSQVFNKTTNVFHIIKSFCVRSSCKRQKSRQRTTRCRVNSRLWNKATKCNHI